MLTCGTGKHPDKNVETQIPLELQSIVVNLFIINLSSPIYSINLKTHSAQYIIIATHSAMKMYVSLDTLRQKTKTASHFPELAEGKTQNLPNMARMTLSKLDYC